jgi:carbonic anhydrase
MKASAWLGIIVITSLCAVPATRAAEHAQEPSVPAAKALERLEQGNQRFMSGQPAAKDLAHDRLALVNGQHPYAIVVACSDSRVAPETIFDAHLGELFVVRVAGNVVDDDVLGSIEYAAMHLHCRLVLMLGHDGCGAVTATLTGDPAPHVVALAKHIEPAAAIAKAKKLDAAGTLAAAVRENVHLQADRVTSESVPLAELVKKGELEVARGVYHLDTGRLELLAKHATTAAK